MAGSATPRRRVSLPVAVGAWAGGRLVSLALLAVTVWALRSLSKDPAWQVQWVEVIGCQYVSADVVVAASGLAGARTVSLVPGQVEARILQVPSLVDVEVEVTGADRVRITVEEDPPVVNLVIAGQDYWATQGGRLTEARSELESLPRVAVAGEWQDGSLARLLAGLSALRAAYPEQLEFTFDVTRGYVFTSALGCPVYFGDASDFERQLAALTALEAELSGQGITPEYISLVSVEGAYYRPSGSGS